MAGGDTTRTLEPTILSPTRSDSAAAGDDPLIGRRLNHFEVVRLLGKGGMGAVYLANDTSLERPVALKILAPDLAHDPDVVARFVREARTQARLRHPNVAQIYFVGAESDIHYFAMEYLEGLSIEKALERDQRLPWEEAIEHVIAAAHGLRAGAAQGFIHRDVKPSNLMLDGASGIKILDFGLVKTMHGDAQLTREGAIIGSPLYMSPEQGQGKDVDLRSDIYSLGCSLYHMVTGQPPFVADSPMGVIAKHITEQPKPVRELAPDIPEALDRLITRMMAKDAAARFADYDELIEAAARARTDRRDLFGFRRRALALAIDLLPLSVATYRFPLAAISAAAYFPLCHRLGGRTLGKWILGLEVVDREGRRITWRASLLRFVVFAWGPIAWVLIAAVVFRLHSGLSQVRLQDIEVPLLLAALVFLAYLAGFLLAAFHPRKLALHDIVAGTQVRYRANPRTAQVARLIRSTTSAGPSSASR